MSIGLFAAAAPDYLVAEASAAASLAVDLVEPAPELPAATPADGCAGDATAALGLELSSSGAETAATCQAGWVWTCCSCGCGCRRNTISPTNYCKFYRCPITVTSR